MSVSKPLVKPGEYTGTYWITRDVDPETGLPGDVVDVWFSRPIWFAVGSGSFWLDRFSGLTERFAQWTLAQAKYVCHVYPDDGLMCIRVGGPA